MENLELKIKALKVFNNNYDTFLEDISFSCFIYKNNKKICEKKLIILLKDNFTNLLQLYILNTNAIITHNQNKIKVNLFRTLNSNKISIQNPEINKLFKTFITDFEKIITPINYEILTLQEFIAKSVNNNMKAFLNLYIEHHNILHYEYDFIKNIYNKNNDLSISEQNSRMRNIIKETINLKNFLFNMFYNLILHRERQI